MLATAESEQPTTLAPRLSLVLWTAVIPHLAHLALSKLLRRASDARARARAPHTHTRTPPPAGARVVVSGQQQAGGLGGLRYSLLLALLVQKYKC